MQYKLEEVVSEFELWRQKRISKKEPIPGHLWTIAKTLLPHYKRAHIQRALRISGHQFSEYLSHQKNNGPSQVDGFATLLIEPTANKTAEETCEITLQGLRKSLHLNISINQLPQILPLLECYL